MTIPIRQYNIMDNIGNAGINGGGYNDFEDFGMGTQSPSPTFPTMGAISRIGQTPTPVVEHAGPAEPNIAHLLQQCYTPDSGASDACVNITTTSSTNPQPDFYNS